MLLIGIYRTCSGYGKLFSFDFIGFKMVGKVLDTEGGDGVGEKKQLFPHEKQITGTMWEQLHFQIIVLIFNNQDILIY